MHDQNGPVSAQTPVLRVNGGRPQWALDSVAIEQALEIRVGILIDSAPRIYERLSVTMRTPGHDAELAVGFLFTERVIVSAADIQSVETAGPAGADGVRNIVTVELREGVVVNLRRLERHFFTNSSCGVCGKAGLNCVRVQMPSSNGRAAGSILRDIISELPGRLRATQSGFDHTGGLHATALFGASGALLVAREDVGRHNAMDKAIGHLVLGGTDRAQVALVSGRASFELVQKAAVAQIPVLAAIGAPSTLAVEVAEEAGVTLIGFVRASRFNVYTHAERVSNLVVAD